MTSAATWSTALLANLAPPPDQSIADWAEGAVTLGSESPFPGRLRIDNSRWLIGPLEALRDPRTRTLTAMAARQSGKSFLEQIYIAWSFANDPAPMLFVFSTGDEAKKYVRGKLMPFLERCQGLAMPEDRYAKSLFEIYFPSSPLWIVTAGGNSYAPLESKSVRRLILDEVSLYKPEALSRVLKVTTAFWNAQTIAVSCPTYEFDEVHRAFMAGDQNWWHFPSPCCGYVHRLAWRHFKYSKVETDGEVDLLATAATANYECPQCKAKHQETPALRKHIVANGSWVPAKPEADPRNRSYQWSAMLPEWISWSGTLLPEWLAAHAARDAGYEEPFRIFMRQRLGEPDRPFGAQDDAAFEQLKVDYKPDDDFGERYIGCDVQESCLFAVCRAFDQTGASRAVWSAKLKDFDELRAHQLRLMVGDKRTLIDAGYDSVAVSDAARRFGWTATRAESFPGYMVDDGRGGKRWQLWRLAQRDPFIGRAGQGKGNYTLIEWSTDSVMDILNRLMRGKGVPWQVPATGDAMCAEYFDHIKAASKRPKVDERGNVKWCWHYRKGHDHLLQAEKMCLLAAIIMGRIKADSVGVAEQPAPVSLTPELQAA